jgi:HEAT repeat protein
VKTTINVLWILWFSVFSTCAYGLPEKAEVENLLRDLKSADSQKALIASQRLADFPKQKKQIVPALIDALKNDWSQCAGDIRDSIAYTLREFDARESATPLLKMLQSGKSIEHECSDCSCCFLPMTPSDEIASRAYEPFCRQGVLMAINEFAEPAHTNLLMSLVTAGISRPELMITLAEVGPPSTPDFIAKFKDDKDFEVRRSVATALGHFNKESVTVPILIRYLEEATNIFIKWAAAESLISIGEENKTPVLVQKLTNLMNKNDKLTMALAAKVLGALQEEKGLLKLRDLTSDADSKTRFEATLALGALADQGSKEQFVQRLKDPNLSVRATAIYALGLTGDSTTIPILQKAVVEANAYQETLKKNFKDTSILHNEYGVNVYNLEATLEEAIRGLSKSED